MGLDAERVERKSAYILQQVRALRELTARFPKEAILGDPWILRGVKYAIQTAIEALIDLSYHVSAKKCSHAPTDARDALRALRDQGIITEDEYAAYGAMVGLRNRIVHGYEDVTPERLYAIITQDLGDLEGFVRRMGVLMQQ